MAVLDTEMTISEITPGGKIKVSFSKALLVPRDENNEPNFKTTPQDIAMITLNKRSFNDYVIEWKFEPVDFDINGRWLTFQLQF